MFHKTAHDELNIDPEALLPALLNGTLAPDEARAVEAALASDPAAEADAAAWRALRSAVAGQPVSAPPPAMLSRVIEQVRVHEQARVPERAAAIQSARAWRWSWAWAWTGGALVALAVIALLWTAVRPGTVLEWSAAGPVQAFRVYRAAAGTAEFSLVDEVLAQSGVTAYTFVDGRVWPGAYVYRVEAVVGEAAVSLAATETVADVGLAVLWERLAIVVIGVCMAYVAAVLLAHGPPRRAMTAV
jgi:anti-sigma factor RsiW